MQGITAHDLCALSSVAKGQDGGNYRLMTMVPQLGLFLSGTEMQRTTVSRLWSLSSVPFVTAGQDAEDHAIRTGLQPCPICYKHPGCRELPSLDCCPSAQSCLLLGPEMQGITVSRRRFISAVPSITRRQDAGNYSVDCGL